MPDDAQPDPMQQPTTAKVPPESRPAPAPPDRPARAGGRLEAPPRLSLQIGSASRTTVGLEVAEQVLIGRSDPVANFQPDLDLSPYGGMEGGVSRRHAVIGHDEARRGLYVEDQSSTNGTYLNGFLLEAGRRYRLHDGDELSFGRVRVTVRFVWLGRRPPE